MGRNARLHALLNAARAERAARLGPAVSARLLGCYAYPEPQPEHSFPTLAAARDWAQSYGPTVTGYTLHDAGGLPIAGYVRRGAGWAIMQD